MSNMPEWEAAAEKFCVANKVLCFCIIISVDVDGGGWGTRSIMMRTWTLNALVVQLSDFSLVQLSLIATAHK